MLKHVWHHGAHASTKTAFFSAFARAKTLSRSSSTNSTDCDGPVAGGGDVDVAVVDPPAAALEAETGVLEPTVCCSAGVQAATKRNARDRANDRRMRCSVTRRRDRCSHEHHRSTASREIQPRTTKRKAILLLEEKSRCVRAGSSC